MPLPAQLNSVSRETLEKLELYYALLLKWQKAINLVSPTTLNEAWQRHFIDSMQSEEYLPRSAHTLVDLGSGAGFPGLILAIMRPDIEVYLVESDERKAQFLRTVSRETSAGCVVIDERIEYVQKDLQPDIVTARALGHLTSLCAYCQPWAAQNPALTMIFPKGRAAEDEIVSAQSQYSFSLEQKPSITSDEASILILSDLQERS